jgi:hypothetical protein
MLYNGCTGIYKFGNKTYPRRIRRRSNLGHIFRGKSCVLWAGKYGTSCSICGGRIQSNILGPTAGSRCGGFPTFRALTPSPSSGCAGGFIEPKLGLLLYAVYVSHLAPVQTEIYTAPVRTPNQQSWFYQTTSYTLKMGTKLRPETPGNLQILKRQECLIEVQNIIIRLVLFTL